MEIGNNYKNLWAAYSTVFAFLLLAVFLGFSSVQICIAKMSFEAFGLLPKQIYFIYLFMAFLLISINYNKRFVSIKSHSATWTSSKDSEYQADLWGDSDYLNFMTTTSFFQKYLCSQVFKKSLYNVCHISTHNGLEAISGVFFCSSLHAEDYTGLEHVCT